jgi:hypothetical protein
LAVCADRIYNIEEVSGLGVALYRFDINISVGVIFIAWVFFIKSAIFLIMAELRSIRVVIEPFYIMKIGTRCNNCNGFEVLLTNTGFT